MGNTSLGGITRMDMEAGPSVIMEESVASNPWLGYVQHKHSIFLSHSGDQKAFVRRLRNALERNAYLPFFDEDPDCLPKGEQFAKHIKNSSRITGVGIVVLSDEFFKNKWPMIELAIFVEEQRRRRSVPECKELKILPLFFGLSVEEFRNPMRQISWLNEWKESRATDSRIDISKWEEAVKVLGGHNGLEYCHFKNEEDYIDSIVSAIFKLVSPDLQWEDTHMKGKSKFRQAVAEMFARSPSKKKFKNVRVIGLYGMGGAGKTTICKSLCNYYFVKFNGKVWHAELGKKSPEEIQKDVLRHLAGTSETLLNQTVKSNDQLRSLLRRRIEYKVFLAIDNVWNEDVSWKQAEALLDMGFHPDSLVILTSRSRWLLEWMGIHKECCFEMPGLDKGDATAVLLQSAAPGYEIQSMADYQRAAVDMLVERCFMTKGPIFSAGSEKQYVPLALEVLGRQFRLPLLSGTSTQLKKWVDNLDLKWSDKKQHSIFSVLQLSYDNLPDSLHKSIFLDVALCVPRQRDNTSASVKEVWKWLSMVYSEDIDAILTVLEKLERDGLVERWQDMAFPFGMHELYCEFAKAEVAKADDFDKQQYLYHEDGRSVPYLMQLVPRHNCLPLRRIHIYGGGFRELSHEELQYMVNVEVLKLDFCFELESLDLRCLKKLRSLELRGCFSLQKVEGLEDLHQLKFFRWNTCRNSIVVAKFPQALEIVEIYGSKESEVRDIGSFGGCAGLLELTLSRHPLLTAVSDLSKLYKLEKVDLSGCCRVKEVRGLEGLRCLKHLNLENCKRLCHCDGLENLVKIQSLNLGGCESVRLPEVWDLSRLVNLRSINIGGNLLVRRLVLGSPQLEHLEVMGCRDLRTVALSSDSGSWKFLNRLNEQRLGEPIESRQWTVESQSVVECNSFDAYETLNLSNCHTLESLGDIGLLTSLKYLYLQNCSMLRTLPNLSGSPHLQVVDLSYCCMLEDLGDIGPLRALQYLYLQHCRSLRSLRDLLSPYLKVMDLTGCSKLEDLGNFDSLRSLQMLNLNECVSLRTVPNLSHSPLLEVLNVKGCVKLSALSQMTTSNVVIDVSECWSLEKFPFLDDLVRVELDVTIGDSDRESGEIGENMGLSQAVHSLKLTCERYSSSKPLAPYTERTEGFLPYSLGERDILDLFRTSENGGHIQIRASYWKEALRALGGTYNLQSRSYENEDQYIDSVVSAIFFPLIRGRSKSHKAVAEMFAMSPSETRFHNVRAIGLYGTGGIGKTTICKSLCNDYYDKFNGKVWHAELGKKSPEEIQKDVLCHLGGTSKTVLNEAMKSNDQWQSLLRRRMECKVFLAIDNVCKESSQHAEALLQMGFHPQSLVIVTSRDRKVLERLGIHKECCFEIPGLDKGDATEVLLHSAPPGYDRGMISSQWSALDKLLERGFMTWHGSERQYVPLALDVLGRQLPRYLANPSTTNLDEHPTSSLLRLIYDNLPSSLHKSIFLDVALFVPRKQDNTSASVNDVCKWLSMVYSEDIDAILRVLEELERDGLVERWQGLASPLNMHELYCEFAKAVVTRADRKEMHRYHYYEGGLGSVPAEMRFFSELQGIRKIHIYGGVFRKLFSMPDVEVLKLDWFDMYGGGFRMVYGMPDVEVLKLDSCFELESLDLRGWKRLRSLELRGCLSLQKIEGLEDLPHLKFIRWNPNLELVAEFRQAFDVGANIWRWLPIIRSQRSVQRDYEVRRFANMPPLLDPEEVSRRGCILHRQFSNFPQQFNDGLIYGSKAVDVPDVEVGVASGSKTPEVRDTGSLRLVQCGSDARHLRDMHRLLDPHEWLQRGYILHRYSSKFGIHSAKFSSLSISSESMIELPTRKSFASVTKLEITKCKRLRGMSDVEYLPALETLVISQCDRLESLPDFSKATALKHLTIRDFRIAPKFQFLSELCQPVLAPRSEIPRPPICSFEKLVQLNLDSCVGLDGLHRWGPLPALESLLIKDCNTITQLPNLRRSSKLSSVIVMSCRKFRGVLDVGSAEALRVVRIEGCGNEKFTYFSSAEDMCRELENMVSGFGVSDELTKWLRGADEKSYCLDMFAGFDFSAFQFTGPTLETFNLLMAQWASPYRGVLPKP